MNKNASKPNLLLPSPGLYFHFLPMKTLFSSVRCSSTCTGVLFLGCFLLIPNSYDSLTLSIPEDCQPSHCYTCQGSSSFWILMEEEMCHSSVLWNPCDM